MLPLKVRGFSRPYVGHELNAVRSAYYLDTVYVRSILPRSAAAGRRRPLGVEDRTASGSGVFLDLTGPPLRLGSARLHRGAHPCWGGVAAGAAAPLPSPGGAGGFPSGAGEERFGFPMPLQLLTNSSRNPLQYLSDCYRKRTLK